MNAQIARAVGLGLDDAGAGEEELAKLSVFLALRRQPEAASRYFATRRTRFNKARRREAGIVWTQLPIGCLCASGGLRAAPLPDIGAT